MESIKPTYSVQSAAREMADLKTNFDSWKFKRLVTRITEGLLAADTWNSNHQIASDDFGKMSMSMLRFALLHEMLINEEFDQLFKNYLKIYLVKTSFKFLQGLLREIFEYLSNTLDRQSENKTMLSRTFSLMQSIVGGNLSISTIRCFSFIGENNSGLSMKSDKIIYEMPIELNLNFTFLLTFYSDFNAKSTTDSVTLISYLDEVELNGYQVFIRERNLYFSFLYSQSTNSIKNEYLIFEDVAGLIDRRWSFFMMSATYDSKSNASNLVFVLNDSIKLLKCPLVFKYPYIIKQNLNIFTNVPGSLSLASMFSRVISVDDYKKTRSPILSQGVVNSNAYEQFVKNFDKEFGNQDLIFLLTGLAEVKQIKNGFSISDPIQQLQFQADPSMNLTENNQSHYENEFISMDIASGIFALFNYIDDAGDLESLMKFIAGILVNERLVHMYQLSYNRNLYSELVGALLSTDAVVHFNARSIETLISIIEMPDQYWAGRYLNEFLLGFNLISNALYNEESTRTYFDILIHKLDLNATLSKLIDLEQVIQTLVMLVYSKRSPNLQKAVQISRLILLSIPLNPSISSLDLLPVFLMLSQIKSGSPEYHTFLIRVLLSLMKVNESKKQYRQMYSAALCNILQNSSDSGIIEKTIKQMLKLDLNPEELILSFWRTKVSNRCDVENTPDVYCAYAETCHKILNADKLTKFLLRMLFDFKTNEEYYGDNMELIKSRRLNVFYEISISLDDANLEKIFQAQLISLRQHSKTYIRSTKETNFIPWVVCSACFSYASRKSSPVFDLSSKLLASYLAEETLLFGETSIFGYVFEIISYMHDERKYRDATSAMVGYIFKELVNRDVIIANENSLNKFLVHVFYVYFNTLRKDSDSPLYKEMIGHMIICLHKNVNNNSNQMLPLAMQKNVAAVINLKNNLHNLIQNSSYRASRTLEMDSVLKMQCYLFSDIAKYCFEKGDPESVASGLMLIREYFANTLNFLEKNRSKLRDDKIVEIELVLQKILVFLSNYPELADNLNEVTNCLILHSNFEITPQSFVCQTLNAFNINPKKANTPVDLTCLLLKSIDASKLTGFPFADEVLIDGKLFIDHTLSEIRSVQIENKAMFLPPTIGEAVKERVQQYRYSNAQDFRSIHSKYLNDIFLSAKISAQDLKNSFYKLYKQQRSPGHLLYRKELDHYFYNFNPAHQMNESYESGRSAVKFKHSKVTTKTLQRPFIKMKPSKYWKGLAIEHANDTEIRYSFTDFLNFKSQPFFSCERVYKLTFVPSFIVLNRISSSLELFIDFQRSQKDTGIELAYYKFKSHKKIRYSWDLQEIKRVHEFKFFNKRVALEFFFKNKQTLLIAFSSRAEMEEFTNLFFEFNRDIKYKTIDTVKIFEMKGYRKKWLHNSISNFEYLMKLNTHASRSLEDFAQYPIMPLVIKTVQPSVVLRELNQPVGMTGDQRRVNTFLKRYELDDPFAEHPNYFYGSHYSSPAIVFNFLIRIRPYHKGCKAIQNGVFDLPDRLFFSINLMLKNVMEEMGDVRELIPELFYLPILYVNCNNFDFGVNQNGERIHNVKIPDIFQNSPSKFVYSLRRILESEETSKFLGDWIDLIFGSKQTGNEAIENKNLFFYLTYEESMRKLKVADEKQRTAIETQIYHFGQTPFKVFYKKHSNKQLSSDQKTIVSAHTQVKYFVKKRDQKTVASDPIFFIKSVNTETSKEKDKDFKNKVFVVKRHSIEVYKFNPLPATTGVGKPPFEFFISEQINLTRLGEDMFKMGFDFSKRSVIEIYGSYKVIYGGFHNGSLAIFSLKQMRLLSKSFLYESMVVKLILSSKNMILTAHQNGVIVISELDPIRDTITLRKTIYSYFGSEIVSLSFVHSDQNFFIVNSDQKIIEVRSVFEGSRVCFQLPNLLKNHFRAHELSSNNLFIDAQASMGYVSCVIIYSYIEHKNHIHTISFDGRVIAHYVLSEEDSVQIKRMCVVTDEFFRDNLILANSKGDLYIFDLPLLENGRRISSTQKIEITSILPFNKRKLLLLADLNGLVDIFSITGL